MSDEWAYQDATGEWVPRLTRVLDIFADKELVMWRGRVGEDEAARVKAMTSRIGKGVHSRIQQRLQGRKITKAKAGTETARAYETWERWLADNPFTATRTEQLLFSPIGFAGTPDCLEDMAMGAPANRVTEWKVTSAIHAKHWIQVNAQAALAWPGVVGPLLASLEAPSSLLDSLSRISHLRPQTPPHGALDSASAVNENERTHGATGDVFGSCSRSPEAAADTVVSTLPSTPRCRIVRVDPFLGIVEPREEPFRPRLMMTFLAMLRVYRDLFFDPELMRRANEAKAYEGDDGDDDGRTGHEANTPY